MKAGAGVSANGGRLGEASRRRQGRSDGEFDTRDLDSNLLNDENVIVCFKTGPRNWKSGGDRREAAKGRATGV